MTASCRVVQDIPEAAIKWPSVEEIAHLSTAIENRCPSLRGSFAFMDGFHSPIAASTIQAEQNPYWSGWKHMAVCTSVIVTTTDGLIRFAACNFPGTWHDSSIVRPLLTAIASNPAMCPDGNSILADSAFAQRGAMAQKILVPLTRPKYREASEQQRQQHKDVVSIRQGAEWAVRDVKGTYKRLRSVMPSNSAKRLQIFQLSLHLHNFRTVHLGLSQVRSVYEEHFVLQSLGYMFPYGSSVQESSS